MSYGSQYCVKDAGQPAASQASGQSSLCTSVDRPVLEDSPGEDWISRAQLNGLKTIAAP